MNICNKESKKEKIKKNKVLLITKLKEKFEKIVNKNKNKFNLKETIVFMTITFVFGMLIGGVVMYGRGGFYGHTSSALNEFT